MWHNTIIAVLIAGAVVGGSIPVRAQNRSNDLGMGPAGAAGSSGGRGRWRYRRIGVTKQQCSPATGSTMFPGAPMSSPSLDLTVQPSATAGAATIGSGTSIGIGGATVGGSEAPALGSTARGVGSNAPGATLDAGANPGLYGTAPGANGDGQ